MSNSILIHHHLGLGDHLDCNGMVRFLLKVNKYDQIVVPSKSTYFDMIQFMYRDEKKIKVISVDPENEYQGVEAYRQQNNIPILKVGFENYPAPSNEKFFNKNCWEFFYDQLQMPYSVRQDYFRVNRVESEEDRVFNKFNPENEPYIFVHEDADRGYEINRKHFLNPQLKVIQNDVSENIFYFIELLENASEVHCMESSFKTLIDLFCKQKNIFYHDFRNQPLGNYSHQNWKVIKYD